MDEVIGLIDDYKDIYGFKGIEENMPTWDPSNKVYYPDPRTLLRRLVGIKATNRPYREHCQGTSWVETRTPEEPLLHMSECYLHPYKP